MSDAWDGARAYEQYMGRWSRRLAADFVRWLGVPAGKHWLEVGCGTGSLTAAICDLADPASVVACEPSETFIAHASTSLRDPRVRFVAAGAGNLPARTGGFDAVVSSLVLNFLPDPLAAVHEMRALAATAGSVAACVWDYAGGMELLRRFWDAAVALDPAAAQSDEGRRFRLCDPVALRATFSEAGLQDVHVDALVVPTPFVDFDDYWLPFLGGAGPAPSYVNALDMDHRRALAARLRDTLSRSDDGTIRLTAKSWCIRGVAA